MSSVKAIWGQCIGLQGQEGTFFHFVNSCAVFLQTLNIGEKMRQKIVVLLTVAMFTMSIGIAQADAIAVQKGNGETTTVNAPDQTQGNGPNSEGANPAHGPSCGLFLDEDGESVCARHSGPEGGVHPPGLNDPTGYGNLGAWNSVFQSNENSAICGIWATTAEAEAAGEPEAPTCED